MGRSSLRHGHTSATIISSTTMFVSRSAIFMDEFHLGVTIPDEEGPMKQFYFSEVSERAQTGL